MLTLFLVGWLRPLSMWLELVRWCLGLCGMMGGDLPMFGGIVAGSCLGYAVWFFLR